MSRLYPAFVALLLLGATGCGGGGIPLPEEGLDRTGYNGVVYGSGADDLWWPLPCENGPAFWHWDGGNWSKVTAAGLECGLVAVAGKGRLWTALNGRLASFDTKGAVTEHGNPDPDSAAVIVSLQSHDGTTVVETNSWDPTTGVTKSRLFRSTGDGFSPLPVPVPGARTLVVNGPDDLWSFAVGPSDDPALGPNEGPAHWTNDHWTATRGPIVPFAPGFPSNNIWALAGVDVGVKLLHFDGSTWGCAAAPLPEPPEHEGASDEWTLAYGKDGGLVLLGRTSKVSFENDARILDEVRAAWRWTGENWSEPEIVQERYIAGCGDYVCGVSVTGRLDDGTFVWTSRTGAQSELTTFTP